MARRTSKPIWEQRRWVAFAILALLLLVSTAASAQTTTTKTNQTTDYSSTVQNPCNGDTVAVSGKHHFMASQQTQKNGRVHMQMTESRNGTGLGAPSGKKYSYGETVRTNAILPAAPEGQPTGIARHWMRVVSEGSSPEGDNFYQMIVTRLHRNGNASESVEKLECRGQGKESF
jgi:hypothetical protein